VSLILELFTLHIALEKKMNGTGTKMYLCDSSNLSLSKYYVFC
jgi:hypothetical protein